MDYNTVTVIKHEQNLKTLKLQPIRNYRTIVIKRVFFPPLRSLFIQKKRFSLLRGDYMTLYLPGWFIATLLLHGWLIVIVSQFRHIYFH